MHKLSIYCIFTFILTSFAVFPTNSLHAQHVHGIRCGTFHDHHGVKRSTDDIHAVRPTLDAIAYFADSTLCVHYDISGENAPDGTDENQNGIPDYIDRVGYWAEYSINFFRDSLGFAPIPIDDLGGGTEGYDIYVVEQGPSGIYGATYKEKQISGIGGQQGRYTTYVEIDNNYSPLDSTGFGILRRPSWYTTGEDALKVTVAHELHHSVQIGAYGDCPAQCTYHEMTSTWIEQRLFPNVFDWEQHIPSVLRDPQTMNLANVSDCISGYRMGLFNEYLIHTQQDSLFLLMWKRVLSEQMLPFSALKAEFEAPQSLQQMVCEFYPMLYFTGPRSYRNTAWPRAAEYPDLELTSDIIFTGSSNAEEYALEPMGVQFHRFIVPSDLSQTTDDTLVVVVTSLDASPTGTVDDTRYHILCGENAVGESVFTIGNSEINVALSTLQGEICIVPIEGFSTSFETKSTAFPQPYFMTRHDVINLPVASKQAGTTTYFHIRNSALEVVLSGDSESSVVENQLVVSVALPRNLPAGVYIWQTEDKLENSQVGKFVVLP